MAETNEYKLIVPQDKQAGVYANALSVTVNEHEVVIDFGYVIPNVQPTQIQLVSRVNVTLNSAESFISTMQNALLDFRLKQKKGREKIED